MVGTDLQRLPERRMQHSYPRHKALSVQATSHCLSTEYTFHAGKNKVSVPTAEAVRISEPTESAGRGGEPVKVNNGSPGRGKTERLNTANEGRQKISTNIADTRAG